MISHNVSINLTYQSMIVREIPIVTVLVIPRRCIHRDGTLFISVELTVFFKEAMCERTTIQSTSDATSTPIRQIASDDNERGFVGKRTHTIQDRAKPLLRGLISVKDFGHHMGVRDVDEIKISVRRVIFPIITGDSQGLADSPACDSTE